MSKKKIEYDTSLAADITIFTFHEDELKVLLVKREHQPFAGKWAIPGGFRIVGEDHDLLSIAKRRLREETGNADMYLEQLQSFGSMDRDPRGWVTSVVHFAYVPYDSVELSAGEGVTEVKWWPVKNGKVTARLAFDHSDIMKVAVERVYSKMNYSPIAAHLLDEEFTIPEFQRIYEVVFQTKLNRMQFRRALDAADILEDTGRVSEKGERRKAVLYRLKRGADKVDFFPRPITRKENKGEVL